MGVREKSLGHVKATAEAWGRAAALAPSTRLRLEWGLAEADGGDLRKAQRIFRDLAADAPHMVHAWRQLASVSLQLGDSTECRRAAEHALAIDPGLEDMRRYLELLGPVSP